MVSCALFAKDVIDTLSLQNMCLLTKYKKWLGTLSYSGLGTTLLNNVSTGGLHLFLRSLCTAIFINILKGKGLEGWSSLITASSLRYNLILLFSSSFFSAYIEHRVINNLPIPHTKVERNIWVTIDLFSTTLFKGPLTIGKTVCAYSRAKMKFISKSL